MKNIINFNFEMNLYTNKELVDIAFEMFKYADIHASLHIEDSMLRSLIEELCMNYNVVSYHNWTHAFQLFHVKLNAHDNSFHFQCDLIISIDVLHIILHLRIQAIYRAA